MLYIFLYLVIASISFAIINYLIPKPDIKRVLIASIIWPMSIIAAITYTFLVMLFDNKKSKIK